MEPLQVTCELSCSCHRNYLSDDSVIDLCCSLAAQGFVLAVTMVREAVDEVRRYQRDKEMNSQLYSKLTVRGQ